MKTTINQRLKAVREDLRLTQAQVAGHLDMSMLNVNRNEKGFYVDVSNNYIGIFCEAFNVNRDWLESSKGEMYVNGKKPDLAKNKVGSADPWRDEMFIQMEKELSAREKMIEFFKSQNEQLTKTLMNLTSSKSFNVSSDVVTTLRKVA